MKNEKIEIGSVAKPQGIRGELKIRLFADSFEQVKGVKNVEIAGKAYKVSSLKKHSETEAIMKLVGLDDRNEAELLRMKEVYASREEVKKEKGTFFVVDLIGLEVSFDDGERLGEVADVVTTNVDYYYVRKDSGKMAIFPSVNNIILKRDIEAGILVVDRKVFNEVALNED